MATAPRRPRGMTEDAELLGEFEEEPNSGSTVGALGGAGSPPRSLNSLPPASMRSMDITQALLDTARLNNTGGEGWGANIEDTELAIGPQGLLIREAHLCRENVTFEALPLALTLTLTLI